MRIKNIIMDMDGVVVDSELIIQKQVADFFKYCTKYDVKHLKLEYLMGSDGQIEIYKKVFSHYDNENIDFDVINRELFKYLEDRQFSYKEIEKEYVYDFLVYCKKQGIKVSLATNSRRIRVNQMLDELCLKNMFCGVIYGEEVKQRKPYPEIYEKSLINNNFKKSETIIIEDSYHGIKAGKTAGVFTVAIKDKYFGINQSEADLIIDNFKDMIEYIKRVNSICS